MRWRMSIEVVIDCAQPDGWKITSVNLNVKQFLSGGGSWGSYIRPLWPQTLAPDRSVVVWFLLRSLWPEQLVTGTWSLHIRMVTVTQSACPSTEKNFGKHLRCLDVGSVVFSGKCGEFHISLLFSCAKKPSWYHVCCLEDGHLIHSLSTKPIVWLNPLKSTRQYGFPSQQFNERSASGKSNRWWQVMFTAYFLFVSMTCSRYKGLLV